MYTKFEYAYLCSIFHTSNDIKLKFVYLFSLLHIMPRSPKKSKNFLFEMCELQTQEAPLIISANFVAPKRVIQFLDPYTTITTTKGLVQFKTHQTLRGVKRPNVRFSHAPRKIERYIRKLKDEGYCQFGSPVVRGRPRDPFPTSSEIDY